MSGDAIELSLEELRALTGWAAACAAPVLPAFERAVRGDDRPRAAIDAALAFASGGPRSRTLRVVALDAYRAALEAPDEGAAHAAHAASAAAGAAFLHPLAKPTQVKHILGAAAHAALARDADGTAPHPPPPPAVVALLRRYPAPPGGGGRLGATIRGIDATLRA